MRQYMVVRSVLKMLMWPVRLGPGSKEVARKRMRKNSQHSVVKTWSAARDKLLRDLND
jgi:hypothetical protein